MTPDELLQEPSELPAVAELRALVEQARAGDVGVLPRLRMVMAEHPEIWQYYGDLAGHAERAWVKLLSGTDLCTAESVAETARNMRSELAGPACSPLERLLIDAVVATWLEAQYYAIVLAATGADGSNRQGESLQQRRGAAHRRHLAAIKALAEVRKLLASTAAQGKQYPHSRSRP